MDHEEARQLLNDKLNELVALGYHELSARTPRTWHRFGVSVHVGHGGELEERRGRSGTAYRLTSRVEWEHKPGGDLLIRVEVIDPDWLWDEVLLQPDGSVKRF